MLKEIKCFSIKGKESLFMSCYNNTVCLAFLSLFITQQCPHKMLWILCASMPCNTKCKFIINQVLQRPPPWLLVTAAVGHMQGKSHSLGMWLWGWSQGNLVEGIAATSPLCFSGKSHSCYLSYCTPPRAAMFYHWARQVRAFAEVGTVPFFPVEWKYAGILF